jgi:hypothetical protein
MHFFRGSDCQHRGLELMTMLSRNKHIAADSSSVYEKRALSTETLFGESRGKMFGVMECLAPDGSITTLKAFSGQYNGLWQVEGWVPPLFDIQSWIDLNNKSEPLIKMLSQTADACDDHPLRKKYLRQGGKALSRKLMKEFHGLYRLTNFHGRTAPLPHLIAAGTGIPTGTGDCCAPKLLNFAATHNLMPLGFAEFYWGRETKSGDRKHGYFYPPCSEKCALVLGYLLCGLEERHGQY